MARVEAAERFRSGALIPNGNAINMLVRQFQFPDVYNENLDVMISHDHLDCLEKDLRHVRDCFIKYTGRAELGLSEWLTFATDINVLQFLIELLKADQSFTWTGYRITGTSKPDSWCLIWNFQLFAVHQDSKTEVYNNAQAPNVRE